MIECDPRGEMLFEMGQCAFRLGKLFAARVEAAETVAEQIEAFELFDRCGFAVRMSVALELRLRREARAEARSLADERFGERDAVERDRSEHDRLERDDDADIEREREREREPVSLPMLLKSLDGVVAAASVLPGPEPAELPTLRELLAELRAGPAPASRAPTGGSLRAASRPPPRPPPSPHPQTLQAAEAPSHAAAPPAPRADSTPFEPGAPNASPRPHLPTPTDRRDVHPGGANPCPANGASLSAAMARQRRKDSTANEREKTRTRPASSDCSRPFAWVRGSKDSACGAH